MSAPREAICFAQASYLAWGKLQHTLVS